MTAPAPAPGEALTAESVWLLRAGDLLRHDEGSFAFVRVRDNGQVVVNAPVLHPYDRPEAFTFVSRPTPAPDPSPGDAGEDLAAELTRIRDKFLMATPDKTHTDYAIITRCIAALTTQDAGVGSAGEGDLIARLRSPLPVCPYDPRSPEYRTAPNDKPCIVCGTKNEDGAPDLCRGADTRCMAEAADLIERRALNPSAAPAAPSEQSSITDELVDRFAVALKDKLNAASEKYGYTDGWMRDDWRADLINQVQEHLLKGDPRDVAAYCAFAWHHGWSIKPPAIVRPLGWKRTDGPVPVHRQYEPTNPAAPSDKLKVAKEALEPFDAVMIDIGQGEDDDDLFRNCDRTYARGPAITVGHIRRAASALALLNDEVA